MKLNNYREYTVHTPNILRFAVLKQQEVSV